MGYGDYTARPHNAKTVFFAPEEAQSLTSRDRHQAFLSSAEDDQTVSKKKEEVKSGKIQEIFLREKF